MIFLIDKIRLNDFNKVFVSSKYKIKKLMGSEYTILTGKRVIYIGKANYSELPSECNKRDGVFSLGYNSLYCKKINL